MVRNFLPTCYIQLAMHLMKAANSCFRRVFGALIRGNPIGIHEDLWQQKMGVPDLQCGVVYVKFV